ncbi:MAG: hypothetical protein ACKOCX_05035, partial [Planctomycetota bacterium]
AQAGKRGVCSKCRTPVIIPAADGAPAARPDAAETATPPPGEPEPEASPPAIGPPDEIPVATDEAGVLSLDVPEPATGAAPENWNFIGEPALEPAVGAAEPVWPSSPPAAGSEGGSPIAQLVARLWVERNHGGKIELHLDGGSVITPEWYDANWSRGTHGLFASQAADGSVTLTAVAWETVRKVVVRQLTEVPDDMFT